MEQPSPVAHVLIFPFPVQGHVNSMLKLAELLCVAGFQVTFLCSDHNYERLVRFTNVQTRFAQFPLFHFDTISDGLPMDHTRSGDNLGDIFEALKIVTKPLFRQMLMKKQQVTDASDPGSQPVTCIISDGILTFTMDVGEELGIPVICFRTISACSFWAYFCLPELIQAGDIPFKDEDMDREIKSLPGMESFLRCRDLPSFCRVKDLSDPLLQLVLSETRNTTRAYALILNTLEALEGPILSLIRTHCSPKLYTVGPLHALVTSRLSYSGSKSTSSSSSLWEEDRSCIKWLDSQQLGSVLYVSFGSLAMLTRDKLLEFWHGLVNSGKPFLWVIRPDSVQGEEASDRQLPAEMMERGRWCIVGWAPQEEVLHHRAVGGFLTHSGWNSTFESLTAGVPMICWPYFADQQINSRYVSQVWKVGLDMKDLCSRGIVEKMVKDLMMTAAEGGKREELSKAADEIAEMVRSSISNGGSSYQNLDHLVEDIKSLKVVTHT